MNFGNMYCCKMYPKKKTFRATVSASLRNTIGFKYHTVHCVKRNKHFLLHALCFLKYGWSALKKRGWLILLVADRLWCLVHSGFETNRVKIYGYRQSLEITAWAETWSQISTATNKDKWIQRQRLSICRGTLLLVTCSPADLLLL